MWLTALYPIKHPRGVAMPGDVFEGDAVLISAGLATASLVAPPPAPVDTTLSITAAQISDAGAGGLEVLKKGSVPEIAALVSTAIAEVCAERQNNTVFMPLGTYQRTDRGYFYGTGRLNAPAGNGNADVYFGSAGSGADRHWNISGIRYGVKRFAPEFRALLRASRA